MKHAVRVAIFVLLVLSRAGAEEPNELRRKALAGDRAAQLSLGETYRLGLGATPDAAQAVRFYQLAAEQNVPEAQFALAEMYRFGEGGAAINAKPYVGTGGPRNRVCRKRNSIWE